MKCTSARAKHCGPLGQPRGITPLGNARKACRGKRPPDITSKSESSSGNVSSNTLVTATIDCAKLATIDCAKLALIHCAKLVTIDCAKLATNDSAKLATNDSAKLATIGCVKFSYNKQYNPTKV